MEELTSQEIEDIRSGKEVDWEHISEYQTLSEDFMREFSERVDWNYISVYQTLSEDFMKEFSERVDWNYISVYQTLSEEFMREFSEKLNHNVLNIKSVHHCGKSNRVIFRKRNNPDIICIGCFEGIKKEAIEAISKKYEGKAREDYIQKVIECFE